MADGKVGRRSGIITDSAGGLRNSQPERLLLKERAYEELKNSMLDGTFPPGTFLSERQLSARLGMSKTPVRAALERLEAEGFVAVAPQQGIMVRELTMDEVVDHFDIRRALETFVVRQLSGRLSPDQARHLEENLEAQKVCAERDDKALYARLDADFHLALCRFHGNLEIERVMLRLRDKVFGVVARVYQKSPGRLTTSYEEHKEIIEALVIGESNLAADRMEEHLLYGKRFLISR